METKSKLVFNPSKDYWSLATEAKKLYPKEKDWIIEDVCSELFDHKESEYSKELLIKYPKLKKLFS